MAICMLHSLAIPQSPQNCVNLGMGMGMTMWKLMESWSHMDVGMGMAMWKLNLAQRALQDLTRILD